MKGRNHLYLLQAVLMVLGVASNQALAQTTPDAVLTEAELKVAAFKTQYGALMVNLKELGSVLNDTKMVEAAERGMINMNSISPEQWDAYVAQASTPGVVPNLAPAVTASAQALSRIQSFTSPLQVTQEFPQFTPNYPACSPQWDDPGYIFEINMVQLSLANILTVLNFVCSTTLPPFGGNFALICLPFSVALGVVGVILDQMGTCRIINGRSSNKTTYDALVYVDNLLRLESANLQSLMDANTQALIVQLREAQEAINNFQNILRDSMIAEIASAITTSQNALIANTNTSLAAVENSIIGTTTALINTAQNSIISHSNQQAAAINANTDGKAAAILAEVDAQTKAILDNLSASSREVMDTVLRLGCEEIRLQALPEGQRSSTTCSQAVVPYASTSSTLLGGSASAPTSATAAVAGGCSALGSSNSSGMLAMVITLLLTTFAMRRKKSAVRVSGLLGFLTLGLLNVAVPASSQNTVASFRAQYEESMTNLSEYFRATGNIEGNAQVQEGMRSLSQVSDQDLEQYFSQLPDGYTNQTAPDLHELVGLTQSLVTNLPAPQATEIDLLKPAQGFPPFGKDFCPARTSDDQLYQITIANNVMDLVMAIMTFICLQEWPFIGNVAQIGICIALAVIQAVINIIYGRMTNCAFLEGGPPVYEALDFIQLDIQDQFATLQEKSNLNTNQLSLQIVETQTSITDTDFAAYNAILAATFANIKKEQNSLIANATTTMSTSENTIVSTTARNLTDATNAINSNTDALTAQIIANANAKAAAIIERAKANAKAILDNVRRDAAKILGTVNELGCQSIQASQQSGSVPPVGLCSGQPGF